MCVKNISIASLIEMFNHAFRNLVIRAEWYTADVTPIYKGKNSNDYNSNHHVLLSYHSLQKYWSIMPSSHQTNLLTYVITLLKQPGRSTGFGQLMTQMGYASCIFLK